MNSNIKSYLGLTIGPIYEVMNNSRKTREMWFGSFFFSLFIKKIYQKLKEDNGICFIIPYHETELPKTRAGLFNDAIICTSDYEAGTLYKSAEKIIAGIFIEFVEIINSLITTAGAEYKTICKDKNELYSKADVERLLKEYIQIGFVVIPSSKIKDGENCVPEMEEYINAIDNGRIVVTGLKKDTCDRCKALEAVIINKVKDGKLEQKQKLCPLCFLKLRANMCREILKETNIKNNHFKYPSTGEISAIDLGKENLNKYLKDEDEDDEIDFTDKNLHGIIGGKDKIKPFHKYLAIVKADGDNLSKIIAASGSNSTGINNNQLSQRLFEFSSAVESITKDYNGELVYAGGDDILAFIPLAFRIGNELKTVIDYAEELSKKYDEIINIGIEGNEESGTIKKSSLSFGISVFYYKYPLSIALNTADELLNSYAKQTENKNSIAIRLTQHSGQATQLLFSFKEDELEQFNTLLKDILLEKAVLPHGLLQKLGKYTPLFINALSDKHIDNIFDNIFKDEGQKMEYTFEDIKKIMAPLMPTAAVKIITSNGVICPKEEDKEKSRKKAFNEILAQLRFIEFIRGEE